MKFSILDASSEKVIAAFEDKDSAQRADLEFRNRGTQLIVEGPRGRDVLTVTSGSDSTLLIATPFGCTRLKVHRGDLQAGGASAGGPKAIKSSMPGKVVRILVEKGQKVEKGQPLLILEAMKMENEIRADAAGIVHEVAVAVGSKIEAGALLIKIGAQ